MAPNTQKGKIYIDNKIHELENPYYSEDYDRGGQFLEDICTGNILEFCFLHTQKIRQYLYCFLRYNLYHKKTFLFYLQYVEYFIDKMHGVDYELRGDYYKISSYTVYLDQLIHFASRRKGQVLFTK